MPYKIWSVENSNIIWFLYLHKVATTAMISLHIKGCSNSPAVYHRLRRLSQNGLVACRSNTVGSKWLWTPTKKGLSVIKHKIPDNASHGFESEFPVHDAFSAAFLLGDWIHDKPSSVEIFTEQQLRNFSPESYPDWIPPSETHRPDGYILVKGPKGWRCIAIEVELNLKSQVRYGDLGFFYDQNKSITDVLWLIPRRSSAKTITDGLKKYADGVPKYHRFVVVDHFLSMGWSADFVDNHSPTKNVQQLFANLAQTRRKPVCGKLSLQSVKASFKTTCCRPLLPFEKFN